MRISGQIPGTFADGVRLLISHLLPCVPQDELEESCRYSRDNGVGKNLPGLLRVHDLAEHDVPIHDIAAVILEVDGAGVGGEVFDILVFAFGEGCLPLVGADFDLHDELAVDPVLEGVADGEDAGGVPLGAGGVDLFLVFVGAFEGVEAGDFVFLGAGVIVDLVFEADGFVVDAVFDAAVAAFADDEFEFQLEAEITVFLCDDVAAAAFGAFVELEHAVFDRPLWAGFGVFFAASGGAVLPEFEAVVFEEIHPAVIAFGICGVGGEEEEGEQE